MSIIKINGATFNGKSIQITNGKVIVDGKYVTPESKDVSIIVEGSIESINADTCSKIEVSGNAGSVKTMSGDVFIEGDVSGSVTTMSGDVRCGGVQGNVSSMSGDIKRN